MEAKINDGGNSGVYFRTKRKPGFMDGYEALSGIRQQSPHIPVLLISGYASSYRSAVNEDYFTEFLTKPFAAADLENRLSLMGVNAAINS